jgi:signal transduction histidine kinase/ActR/RegA family two-component response regulator
MLDNGATRHRLFVPFLWAVTGFGGLALVYSAFRLDHTQFNINFCILLAMALLLGSRIIVPIPRFSSQISVSDTFVFLILWLYGGEVALIVASLDAIFSTLRFSRKARTILFNWGCSALSVFVTSTLLQLLFGPTKSLPRQPMSATFLAAICTMALAHYVCNSGIVAIGAALKTDQPIWSTWRKHYLWTSITYFAGASAAGVIAALIYQVGFYAFLVTLPIIGIVFVTYRTYLKNIETSAAQADQAERHVKELSHYIAEQERIREQFSQLEKLSALGELASGVAHDFNNTLAGILGRAQLLQRTNDPEKIRRGLDIIIKTAEDGARTVKRIQDFARQRRDHDFEPVSIDQILTDASEFTRPRWKNCAEAENIHITLDLQNRSKARVMGDESELREVLVNMVFNAIDAMPEGGTLSLSSRIVAESVVITVADTGVGMFPDVRSRVFDPFFTTKGKAGLGLGLAVSFGIIRRHGGNIEVDSQHGQGTKFRITLPIASISADSEPHVTVPEEVIHPTTSVSRIPEHSQLRLLVVDDEDFVRDLLREILEAEGCKVTLAENGDRALQLFQDGQFEGVFTDVGMPGMSGWELAQAIREQSEMIPIAVITGWGEAVGSNEQKEARVDWVIAKPFTADRISELVRDISRQRGGVNAEAALATVAA